MESDPGIISIGIDLVDIARFTEAIDSSIASFRAHVFTQAEWLECEMLSHRHEALAIRFAAKEACLKALRTGWAKGATLAQVSSTTQDHRLDITLTGAAARHAQELGVKSIDASAAVAAGTAMVVVVLVR